MKKIFILLSMMALNYSYSQDVMNMQPQLFMESLYLKDFGTYKISDVQGTSYVNDAFTTITFADNYQPVKARYNNYSDQIEFKRDEQIYILPNTFDTVTFSETREKMKYFSNTDPELNGYFYEVADKKALKVYKKISVVFQPPKKAVSTYGTDQPASFSNPKTTYYFYLNSELVKIPKNSKDIVQLFPQNKASISSYLKTNKMKLDNELDLYKFAEYIDAN